MPDHLADKICAMYEWHATGTSASTRCRDLADILLIAQQDSIHGAAVQIALRSEQQRRTGIGTDLRLPRRFEIPDLTFWTTNYPSAAADAPGLIGCRNLSEATKVADAFVTRYWQARTQDTGTLTPQDGADSDIRSAALHPDK